MVSIYIKPKKLEIAIIKEIVKNQPLFSNLSTIIPNVIPTIVARSVGNAMNLPASKSEYP